MITFRDLTADEIDVRVGTVSEKGVTLLLYKDARVDMNILDETFGAENWQRQHYECKGNLFCTVAIKCGAEWIAKSDCGTESKTEAEKGEASDSFKRACVNWGIGRELYTSPFIWVSADNCKIDGKKCNDKFIVENIVIKNKTINALTIINAKTGKEVFTLNAPQKPKKAAKSPDKPKADKTIPETPKTPEKASDKPDTDKPKEKSFREKANEAAQELAALRGDNWTAVKVASQAMTDLNISCKSEAEYERIYDWCRFEIEMKKLGG